MKYLEAFVDGVIFARIEGISDDAEEYRLHSIEAHGIWVSHEKITEFLFKTMAKTILPQSLVIFVPWSKVFWILGIDEALPSLSERLLDPTSD